MLGHQPVDDGRDGGQLVVGGLQRRVEGQGGSEEDGGDESVAERQREERVEARGHDAGGPGRRPDVQLTQTPPHVVSQLPTIHNIINQSIGHVVDVDVEVTGDHQWR